ncbi:MAG: acyltransferase domain-containing protein, partial [Bythopirellula sp.]
VEQGERLYQTEPVFRQFVDDLEQHWADHGEATGTVPRRISAWAAGETRGDVELFVLQAGLATLWRAWGIEPDLVLGLGIGQYTAACMAGSLDVKDALLLVARREKVMERIGQSSDYNGIDTVIGALPADVQSELDQFEALADTMNFYPPNLPLVCSLSASLVPVHRSLGGSYWREHCLSDAKVVESLAVVHEHASDFVLEIGPPGTDLSSLQPVGTSRWLASLQQHQAPSVSLLNIMGELYASGAQVDFRALDAPWSRRRLSLPAYPFQKKRYWITEISDYLERNTEQVAT